MPPEIGKLSKISFVKTLALLIQFQPLASFLKNGIRRIKPKLIPGKPPTLAQQFGFIFHYLMLKKLQRDDESMVQLFVDGMHLVHQVIPTFY